MGTADQWMPKWCSESRTLVPRLHGSFLDVRAGVLFDVGGTLMDTNYIHALAWARAFCDAGEWAPMNAIHRLVGVGGDQLVPEALGHDSAQPVEARSTRYDELIGEERGFPGARDLVIDADRRGLAIVLATSSPADQLDVLLAALDIDDFLEGKMRPDDIGKSKPAADVFLTAMAGCADGASFEVGAQ